MDVNSGAVRVGAVVYGTSGFLQFTLQKYSSSRDIQNALGKMSFSYRSSKSNWNSAFTVVSKRMFTASRGDRADAQNVLMIVTDSDDNAKKRKALQQSMALKRKGVLITAVGIGQDRTSALNGLVTTPLSENTFYTSGYNGLQALRGGIISKLMTGEIWWDRYTEAMVVCTIKLNRPHSESTLMELFDLSIQFVFYSILKNISLNTATATLIVPKTGQWPG